MIGQSKHRVQLIYINLNLPRGLDLASFIDYLVKEKGTMSSTRDHLG